MEPCDDPYNRLNTKKKQNLRKNNTRELNGGGSPNDKYSPLEYM